MIFAFNATFSNIMAISFCRGRNQGCTRLATASDKVYKLLPHGRWFSPVSSPAKTDRHDIAESGVKRKNHQITC
jgi:hypothetical protein